jgi:hypothetical protein
MWRVIHGVRTQCVIHSVHHIAREGALCPQHGNPKQESLAVIIGFVGLPTPTSYRGFSIPVCFGS